MTEIKKVANLNMLKQSTNNARKTVFTGKNDEFTSNIDKEVFLKNAVKHILNFDFEKLSTSLIELNAWSNGVDYIGGNYDENWQLKEMTIGIFNSEKGEYEIYLMSKKEYIAFLEQLREKYIAQNPSEVEKYNSLYAQIIERFENISEGKI